MREPISTQPITIEAQPPACPPHNPSGATEGPWVGRCTKCGAAC